MLQKKAADVADDEGQDDGGGWHCAGSNRKVHLAEKLAMLIKPAMLSKPAMLLFPTHEKSAMHTDEWCGDRSKTECAQTHTGWGTRTCDAHGRVVRRSQEDGVRTSTHGTVANE